MRRIALLDLREKSTLACRGAGSANFPVWTVVYLGTWPNCKTTSLSERAQHLLRVLVESYIREGQPVGSRSLSRDSGLEPQRRDRA